MLQDSPKETRNLFIFRPKLSSMWESPFQAWEAILFPESPIVLKAIAETLGHQDRRQY